jgi:hypothetical protein
MMADNPMAQTALWTVLAPLVPVSVEVAVGMLVRDLVGVVNVVRFPMNGMVVVVALTVRGEPSGPTVAVGASGLTVMMEPSESTVVTRPAGASGLIVMLEPSEPTVVVGPVGPSGLLGSIGSSK